MFCQLRTVGAGIGVLATCFMLASLSWQFLLLGFALASIAWAIWSCALQLRPAPPKVKLAPPAKFDRRRARRPENVLGFPPQEWGNQSITN